MKLLVSLAILLVACQAVMGKFYNVTCFYDTSSIMRGGSANFTTPALQASLQLCTHIVYGYVGIRPETFDIVPLDKRQLPLLRQVSDLKKKYRNVKFLLGVGSDQDHNEPQKYMQLLGSGRKGQQTFAKSAQDFLMKYQFDGLDLSLPLPRNKAVKNRSKMAKLSKKIKMVAKDKVAENLGLENVQTSKSKKRKSEVRREQVTKLIGELKTMFMAKKLMLTLTVLPNVNSSKYINVPAVMGKLDFVNLAAFDYSSPLRNPKLADYLAPLNSPPKHAARNPKANIDAEVRYWLSQRANPKQLNLAVAAFGRTWKLNNLLKKAELPIVSALDGPAAGDSKTHTPGLISRSELCSKLAGMTKFENKEYGGYAYRAVEVKGSEGLLVTYDSVDSIAEKAKYVQNHNMGGMALFDLSLDDFNGQCGGDKFPLLQTIRRKLL